MYILIKAGLASKWELETCYSLDEALKLYALYIRDLDIQRIQAEEMRRGLEIDHTGYSDCDRV